MKELSVDTILASLCQELPPIFSRKAVPKLLGETISSGTLANLSSEGLGPPSIRNGRNTIYEKKSFLVWFESYLKGGLKALQVIDKDKEE